jgi:hypothetical protein
MVCGLVAIFAAGVVVGGSVGFVTGKKKSAPQPVAAERREQGPKRDFADKWCSKLTDDLNLTPEQVDKIKPITERTSLELKTVHADHSDRVKAIFKTSHEQIKPILTSEQLEIFERKNREREKRFRGDKDSASKPRC